MMAPFVYEQARANAPFHVQLCRCYRVGLPDDTASLRVTCRVLRIFRNGGGSLHFGQRVSFTIPLINRAGRPLLDGVIRLDPDYLFQARFWEAFLDGWDGEFHLVRSQIAPIRWPTWEPVCGPEIEGFLCRGNFRSKVQ